MGRFPLAADLVSIFNVFEAILQIIRARFVTELFYSSI